MIVIIDFTLVVGMDSSAAHAVAKLKKIFHRLFHVEVSIFVTGSDRGGFPCEFALSQALSPDVRPSHAAAAASDRVCESLDDALKFAEDILISRVDPSLGISNAAGCIHQDKYCASSNMSIDEEKSLARSFLIGLLLSPEDVDPRNSIDVLISLMQREEYKKGQSLWEQGCDSDSAKLLIYGELSSIIEDTGAPELVRSGNIVGELGLVHGTKRLTTLICSTEKAILYNLSKESWEKLNQENLQAATLMQGVVIRYLAHRVQHVSNRYFHTTLPV